METDTTNLLNCCKAFLLQMGPTTIAFTKVYKMLNSYGFSVSRNIRSFLEKVSYFDETKFTELELSKIEKLKDKKNVLLDFEMVPLWYKLIRYAANSEVIDSPNSSKWTADCSLDDDPDLEQLLFTIKEETVKDTQNLKILFQLTETDIIKRCEKLSKQLQKLIQKAGERNNLDKYVIEDEYSYILYEINDIQAKQNFTVLEKVRIMGFLRDHDINKTYLSAMEKYFIEAPEEIVPLKFLHGASQKIINVQEFFPITLNDQLTVISGEEGSGKTEFTKFLVNKWILGETSSIQGLSMFEIMLRAPCTSFAFVYNPQEDELLFKDYVPYFDSERNDDTRSRIGKWHTLWIFDGFDEGNLDFGEFLDMFLFNFSMNSSDKLIITTHPNQIESLHKLHDIKNLRSSILSIKPFDEEQMQLVINSSLADQSAFNCYYKNLNSNDKKILQNPLYLKIFLDLWPHYEAVFSNKNISVHRLHELNFERKIKQLSKNNSEQAMSKFNEQEWNECYKRWFTDSLCKTATESYIKNFYELSLNKWEDHRIIQAATNDGINVKECLSSFLGYEVTYIGKQYSFKHQIEKEVLCGIFMRDCVESFKCIMETMKSFVIKKGIVTEFGTFKRISEERRLCDFTFLFNFCSSDDISKIFRILLKIDHLHLFASDLLNIKERDDVIFKALKEDINKLTSPIKIYGINDSQTFKDITHCLLPEVREFSIVSSHFQNFKDLNPDNEDFGSMSSEQESCSRFYDDVNNFLSDKQELTFYFTTSFSFDIESNSSIDEYFDAFFNNCSKFRNYNRSHAHFIVTMKEFDLDSTKLITRLLEAKDIFKSVSIGLNFIYTNSVSKIEPNLLTQFKASTIKIIHLLSQLQDGLDMMQFYNLPNISHRFHLSMYHISTTAIENFFENWNWESQKNIETFYFRINIYQLMDVYRLIHEDVIAKTIIYIRHDFTKFEIPSFNGKKFKNISFFYDKTLVDPETYNAMTSLAESVYPYIQS